MGAVTHHPGTNPPNPYAIGKAPVTLPNQPSPHMAGEVYVFGFLIGWILGVLSRDFMPFTKTN